MPDTVSYAHADAGAFVVATQQSSDAVAIDVFCQGAVPDHLLTDEFADAIARTQAPGGVLAWNLSLEHEGYALVQRVVRLLDKTGLQSSAFIGCPAYVGNAIVFAGPGRPRRITLRGAPRKARQQLWGANLVEGAALLEAASECALCQKGAAMFDASDRARPHEKRVRD